MDIRTPYSKIVFDGEVNTKPSMTVPDQALTVREIIDRFTRGLAPQIAFEKVYSDENPDIRGLDIVQLEELRKETSETIEFYENAQAEAKKKIAYDAKMKFEKWLADQKNVETPKESEDAARSIPDS